MACARTRFSYSTLFWLRRSRERHVRRCTTCSWAEGAGHRLQSWRAEGGPPGGSPVSPPTSSLLLLGCNSPNHPVGRTPTPAGFLRGCMPCQGQRCGAALQWSVESPGPQGLGMTAPSVPSEGTDGPLRGSRVTSRLVGMRRAGGGLAERLGAGLGAACSRVSGGS